MKEEHSRFFIQWLVPAIFMTVIIIIMFFNFFTRVKLEAIDSYEDEMTQIVNRYAEKVNSDMTTMQTAGAIGAQIIFGEGEIKPESVRRVASALVEHTPAKQVVYYTGNGRGINQLGQSVFVSGQVDDEKLHQPAAAYQYVETNKGDFILLMLPVEESSEQKLLMYYPVERVRLLTNMSAEFDAEAISILINVDGDIFHRSDRQSAFLQKENLWETLPAKYQNSVTKAKVQIMNQSTGCMEAAVGEEERTLVFAPVGVNEWALVVGVNQDYVDKREMKMWKSTSTMLLQLMGVIFFFLGIFIVVNILTRKKTEERDRMLQEKADTDLLTGLSNKLATERKIKEYIQEYPNTLAMMFVLDIDNFKKINDTMGHAFGDEVLRCLGKQVSSVFRVTDIVGRTGGDEFTIFLKFLKDDTNTLKEANKLVNFFKDFVAGEYVKYSATASIGAAVFPTHGSDFETLYKSADKALYKAKQRGKNQLAFYDDRDRVGIPEGNEVKKEETVSEKTEDQR